jgi:hypothetical protein
MKKKSHPSSRLNPYASLVAGIFLVLATAALADDPRTNSWLTAYSGKYARIYTTDVNKTNGFAITMWTNTTGGTTQAVPVYCGVQEVYSSSNWVYIRSSGLSSHIMGPWYLDAAHKMAFPNYPTNEHVLYKIPRTATNATTKTANSGGAIGYFVDGVAMFNSWDAYSWNGTTNVQGAGNGSSWNRDAYVNEGASFDPNNAHQAGGQHHYHANPPALRYLLGDHVDFNSVSKAYTESTNTATKHSPILGWVADGWPIYGPYGYAVSNNASSGVRRMISGYVLRNGQNGTDNLTNTVRANSPAWAIRLYGSNSPGPANLTYYPVGIYMEDNAWLGDLTNSQTGQKYIMGTDFDLDEYNGRWCVTPEFPNGTYAYFVAISSNGTPVFPYNIGRGYYGNPTGAAATSITESVVTNFLGGPNAAPSLNAPAVKNSTVTLTWSATEGGTYMVQSTTNFSGWTTNSTTVAAVLNAASNTNISTDNQRFYRVAQTALATYDSPGTGGYTPTFYSYSPGGSATRGTTVTVTNTLAVPPPSPPLDAPLPTVTLAGSISGSSISHPATNIVVCTFTIPTNAPTGSQNIVITFSGPPNPWTNSFTIN